MFRIAFRLFLIIFVSRERGLGQKIIGICRFRCSGIRLRLNLINLRVLKIEHTLQWRCWTLPLLWFDRERMQLVYEVILLNKILRNHLLSENRHHSMLPFSCTGTWNFAWHFLAIGSSTTESKNIVKLLAIYKPNHSHRVLRGRFIIQYFVSLGVPVLPKSLFSIANLFAVCYLWDVCNTDKCCVVTQCAADIRIA